MNDRDHKKAGPADDPAPDDAAGVGYGHPPVHTRWPPGRSGNRKGRPKGSRNRKTIVNEIAGETHKIVENGKRRRRSTVELVLLALRKRAFDGHVRAFRTVHALLQRYDQQETQTRGGFLVLREPLPLDEWQRRAAEQQRKYRER